MIVTSLIIPDDHCLPYRAHDVDHLTADGAGLLRGQIAVVALLEAYADLGGSFHLEALEGVLGLGNSNVRSVSHVFSPLPY